jgi:hypothetical protein
MQNEIFEQLRKVKIIGGTALLCKKGKMHAVSMTPHARCMRCMSLTLNALCMGVIDTACTIDERFELPWQPLKGISIKNTYVREMFELSYPTTTKIYTI